MHKRRLWKWLIPVVCVGILVFTGVFFVGCDHEPADTQPITTEPSDTQPETVPTQPKEGEIYDRQWEPVYNNLGVHAYSSGGEPAYPAGYYFEDMTPEQLDRILPDKRTAWTGESGRAGFLVTGEADCLSIRLTTEAGAVSLTLGNVINVGSAVDRGQVDPIKSQCGNISYTIDCYVIDYGDVDNAVLRASTTINGVPAYFRMYPEDVLEGTEIFTSVLECFSWYGENAPALEQIKPSRIPDFINEKLSHAQALEDPDFGPWLLKELPADLMLGECWRRKDYNNDYLTASWSSDSTILTNTEDFGIQWRVSGLAEYHKEQIISPAETEKYDLSLYPQPRAFTVPDELESVVSNPIFRIEDLSMDVIMRRYDTASYDIYGDIVMKFGVLYGDILVQVNVRNVEPQWLYEQLMKLPKS